MKIAPDVYAGMKADIATVLKAIDIPLEDMDHGNGLKAMHNLLSIVSRNRAYTDEHPNFATKLWKRYLPYDGRDYCWYYANGCDDTHLATALRKIKTELLEAEAASLARRPAS